MAAGSNPTSCKVTGLGIFIFRFFFARSLEVMLTFAGLIIKTTESTSVSMKNGRLWADSNRLPSQLSWVSMPRVGWAGQGIGQEGWVGIRNAARERRAKKISLPAQSKALRARRSEGDRKVVGSEWKGAAGRPDPTRGGGVRAARCRCESRRRESRRREHHDQPPAARRYAKRKLRAASGAGRGGVSAVSSISC